jgi:hypothetical protein
MKSALDFACKMNDMSIAPDPPADVSMPLKQFLTFSDFCPPRWKGYDLYLISDEQVTFYVGQSHCAYARLWEHIRGGPKGHALLGRFILCNWPRSAAWTVTLLSASSPRFAAAGFNRDAAECLLIAKLKPCLNVALNHQPTPLPAEYLPPNTPIKNLRSFRRMLREAGYSRRSSIDDTEWEK